MLSLAGDYDFGDDEVNCQGIEEREQSSAEKNQNQAHDITLLPNPAFNQVEARLPGIDSGGVLYVLDKLGRMVLRQAFLETPFTFSINSLPKGIYTCHISLEIQKSFKTKWVIVH
jgi:hypothetical protein